MTSSRIDPTLRFLFDLQFFGIKAGLENVRTLLSFLGNPERRYPSIHIAGTNGKGSTASMIASILTASGHRTGLYTSPHLVDFNERVRIDGKAIPRGEIIRYTECLKPIIRKTGATFFEATTAMAFKHFAEGGVDVAVVETGLGGRWDATNVITPIASVITNIGLEHTEYLGSTLSRIAFEKAGIIKSSVPCVTGVVQPDALGTLRRIAASRGSDLISADRFSSVEIVDRSLNDLRVRLQTREARYENLAISLAGDHQARNAQLAVLAIERIRMAGGIRGLSKGRIIDGLASIRRNTGLRGRLDLVRTRPRVIADVAHNPDGAMTLSRSLRALGAGTFLTVFGVMRDKDYRSMAGVLAPLSRLVIAVRPEGGRALETGAILDAFHRIGQSAIDGESVANGMNKALQEVREGEPILVTGSHYLVGELLKFFNSDA